MSIAAWRVCSVSHDGEQDIDRRDRHAAEHAASCARRGREGSRRRSVYTEIAYFIKKFFKKKKILSFLLFFFRLNISNKVRGNSHLFFFFYMYTKRTIFSPAANNLWVLLCFAYLYRSLTKRRDGLWFLCDAHHFGCFTVGRLASVPEIDTSPCMAMEPIKAWVGWISFLNSSVCSFSRSLNSS